MKTPTNIAITTITALTFAFSAAAYAGPRTSTNYGVATDTVDAGGRQTTSASYANDASLGGVAGISTVASPTETAKHGYLGQLYEVVGLLLNPATTTVNEAATVQLGVWHFLDDASLLALSPASVAWSVTSGPISGISAAGLATAGAVYQNSPAVVQGSVGIFAGSANLTVIDTIRDNFGAYGGDSLSDDWQVQYFGQPPNASAGPNVDTDGSGHTNLFKYIAGLVPFDANSRFLLSITSVPGQSGQTNVVFSPRFSGRTYIVKYRTDLTTGSWSTLTGTTESNNGTERTVIDLNATGVQKFYHIEITNP